METLNSIGQFFVSLLDFITQIINDIINTAADIMAFLVSGVEAVTEVSQVAIPGMDVVRGLILTLPPSVFAVMAGAICILLLISLLKIFL